MGVYYLSVSERNKQKVELKMTNNTNTVLILRTCKSDMSSYNGFIWPTKGPVECPDWDPKPVCGNGLHGLLWGMGDSSLMDWDEDSKYFVVEVNEEDVVKIDDSKVKFPRGVVVFCGDRKGATDLIVSRAPVGTVVHGASIVVGDKCNAVVGDYGTATAGYRGTATAGRYGTASAGYRGTATAGDCGKASAGDGGTATAGDCGKASAGDGGTATAGYRGTASAGNCGKASAGDGGTATAGNGGTATAGDFGTATAGYRGTASAGDFGTASAGDCGRIQIEWYEKKTNRYRISMAYVGENGIEANVFYKLDENGNFIKA
jgi:hypothetical protein